MRVLSFEVVGYFAPHDVEDARQFFAQRMPACGEPYKNPNRNAEAARNTLYDPVGQSCSRCNDAGIEPIAPSSAMGALPSVNIK